MVEASAVSHAAAGAVPLRVSNLQCVYCPLTVRAPRSWPLVRESMRVQGDRPPPAAPLRETGVAQVMTSTKVDKHPTAFTATGLPILQVALNVKQMTARLAPLLRPLAGPTPPAVAYARLLAYKQGNRGTIRYQVTGLDLPAAADDDGRPGSVSVLGKLYPQPNQAQ